MSSTEEEVDEKAQEPPKRTYNLQKISEMHQTHPALPRWFTCESGQVVEMLKFRRTMSEILYESDAEMRRLEKDMFDRGIAA